MPSLTFTGERFTPECVREIWYEHVHRYALARQFATGKRVLDVACGEGYGSAIVAPAANTVLGIDVSAEAIRHARSRYGLLPNLVFREGDATCLQLGEERFDLVLSFETLEHVEQQESLVAGIAAALAPGGSAVISSPDKATYSDLSGYRNEFHVRELYRDELLALLSRHFRHVRLYGQRLMFHSAVWDLSGMRAPALVQTALPDGRFDNAITTAPMYYLAVCAQQESDLLALPAIGLFSDAAESVYSHYQHEIRQNMRAGAVLAEREAELGAARQALAAAELRIRMLESASEPRFRFWPFGRK